MAEIRFRAERALGTMMAGQRDAGLMSKGAQGLGSNQHQVRVAEEPAPPTLAEAGIDKNLADRARKFAAIPEKEFNGIVSDWRDKVEQEADAMPLSTAVTSSGGAFLLNLPGGFHGTLRHIEHLRCFADRENRGGFLFLQKVQICTFIFTWTPLRELRHPCRYHRPLTFSQVPPAQIRRNDEGKRVVVRSYSPSSARQSGEGSGEEVKGAG